MVKQSTVKKQGVRLLLLSFLLLAFTLRNPQQTGAAITDEPVATVTGADDLNAALGGHHTVKGNTLILEEDVSLTDGYIRIENAAKRITIDGNGKKFTGTADPMFAVDNSSVRFIGEGTYQASNRNHFLTLGDGSRVTIEDGTFSADRKYSVFLRGDFKTASEARLVINGGKIGTYAVDTDDSGTLFLTIKGGKVGQVKFGIGNWSYLPDPDDPRRDAMPHRITISGGSVNKITSIGANRITLNGGTIGTGGIHVTNSTGKIYSMKVNKGRIKGSVFVGVTVALTVNGGRLSDVYCGGKFVMKGGMISSAEKYALELQSTEARIEGGTIRTEKKNGIAVRINRTKLSLSGGKIVSKNLNGKIGIQLDGKWTKWDHDRSELVLSGVDEGKVIRGFRVPTYIHENGGIITLTQSSMSLSDVIVSTAEELNAALGGKHTVKENTLILEEDVTLTDKTISIADTKHRITINGNGKKITSTNAIVFTLSDAKLRFVGDGTYQAADGYSFLSIYNTSDITIDAGTFTADDRNPVFKREYSITNQAAKLTVNGGCVGPFAVKNYGGGTLYVTVNAGKLIHVQLSGAEYYDLSDKDDPHRRALSNKMILKGGDVSQVVAGGGDRVILNGGTVGNGGVTEYEDWNGFHLTVKKGTVKGPVAGGDGSLKISGGTLSTVSWGNGTFVMSGGKIVSNADTALILDKTKGSFKGGTIRSTKKGGVGVRLSDDTKLTVTGGRIVSRNGNGSIGIRVDGYYSKYDTTYATLYLKGVKADKVISGFRKSTSRYKKGGKILTK